VCSNLTCSRFSRPVSAKTCCPGLTCVPVPNQRYGTCKNLTQGLDPRPGPCSNPKGFCRVGESSCCPGFSCLDLGGDLGGICKPLTQATATPAPTDLPAGMPAPLLPLSPPPVPLPTPAPQIRVAQAALADPAPPAPVLPPPTRAPARRRTAPPQIPPTRAPTRAPVPSTAFFVSPICINRLKSRCPCTIKASKLLSCIETRSRAIEACAVSTDGATARKQFSLFLSRLILACAA
jgi:hypothetical protein